MKFVDIAVGTNHACAITLEGDVYCWGDGGAGRLGDGETSSRSTPVLVAAPQGVKFASIAAGGYHACGVTITGEAYCWGAGTNGVLGTGDTDNQTLPTLVTKVFNFALFGRQQHTPGTGRLLPGAPPFAVYAYAGRTPYGNALSVICSADNA